MGGSEEVVSGGLHSRVLWPTMGRGGAHSSRLCCESTHDASRENIRSHPNAGRASAPDRSSKCRNRGGYVVLVELYYSSS